MHKANTKGRCFVMANSEKSIFRIKPDKERIAELDRQHKERINKYSVEERLEAINKLAGCLSGIDVDKSKTEAILR